MACWARWHPCAMDFVERRRTPIWPQTVAPWFNGMIIGVQKLPDVDKVPNFAQIVKWFLLCYVNNMFIWYDVYMFVVSQNSGGCLFNGDPLYWARTGNAVKIQGAQVSISGNWLSWGWAKKMNWIVHHVFFQSILSIVLHPATNQMDLIDN